VSHPQPAGSAGSGRAAGRQPASRGAASTVWPSAFETTPSHPRTARRPRSPARPTTARCPSAPRVALIVHLLRTW